MQADELKEASMSWQSNEHLLLSECGNACRKCTMCNVYVYLWEFRRFSEGFLSW